MKNEFGELSLADFLRIMGGDGGVRKFKVVSESLAKGMVNFCDSVSAAEVLQTWTWKAQKTSYHGQVSWQIIEPTFLFQRVAQWCVYQRMR